MKLIAFLYLTTWTCNAAEPTLLCGIEKPTAEPGESVHLKAWLAPTPVAPPQLSWSVDSGKVEQSSWMLEGVPLGRHVARVSGGAPKKVCSVQLFVVSKSRGGRETGRGYLIPGKSEKAGYGLYSYLLLGSPPDDSSRERYLKALEVYLRLSPSLDRLEEWLRPKQLNAGYVPMDATPAKDATPEWLLQHYDYARARAILTGLPGAHLHGPYLVSIATPVQPGSIPQPYLYQDLSLVPPSLVAKWYEEFLNQAAQDHFWETHSGPQFLLKLRTTIGILALGLPDVQKGVDSWIKWVK